MVVAPAAKFKYWDKKKQYYQMVLTIGRLRQYSTLLTLVINNIIAGDVWISFYIPYMRARGLMA
jgi:hypothetical protein